MRIFLYVALSPASAAAHAFDGMLAARQKRAVCLYLCHGKPDEAKCQYGKSVRKDKLESEFGVLLSEMKPSTDMFFLAAEIFTDLWNSRRNHTKQEADAIRRNLIQIERKTEQFFDRIAEADNSILTTAYEKKIRQLEEEKIELDERIVQCGCPLQSFDETFRTAFSFLSNPHKIWIFDRLEYKIAVLKLAFSERFRYCSNEGFRT